MSPAGSIHISLSSISLPLAIGYMRPVHAPVVFFTASVTFHHTLIPLSFSRLASHLTRQIYTTPTPSFYHLPPSSSPSAPA